MRIGREEMFKKAYKLLCKRAHARDILEDCDTRSIEAVPSDKNCGDSLIISGRDSAGKIVVLMPRRCRHSFHEKEVVEHLLELAAGCKIVVPFFASPDYVLLQKSATLEQLLVEGDIEG